MDIGPTLEFARRLAARGTPVWVRFVLVPGHTDEPDEIAGIARFAAGLGNVQRVDVLPFHQMGRFKWAALGLEYALGDVQLPSAEAVERACAVFRAEGLTVYEIRGAEAPRHGDTPRPTLTTSRSCRRFYEAQLDPEGRL